MTQTNGVAAGAPALRPATTKAMTTDFDWLVYADATFAGLAILLPIPFVDSWLEDYFRRRMPRDIARRRGRVLSKAAVREVNRERGQGFVRGCLLWPLEQVVYLVRNMYRTVVYFFTVVDATDKLSHYWHRAFLIDYMIARGYLDDPVRAAAAGEALRRVLQTVETSPMRNLAGELIQFSSGQARGLIRAFYRFLRHREQTAEFKHERQTIADRWAEFADYLPEVADTYDKTLAAVQREHATAAKAG